jgi:hypothetical protein
MTTLDTWLIKATRHLSKDSAAQVRSEIQQHYESTYEDALRSGATSHAAGQAALAALGDPRQANCQYRKVLLTSAEAKLLRESNWEARAFCSIHWLKWALLGIPVAAMLAGAIAGERILVAIGITTAFFCAAPVLPIYTPARSKVFRGIKYVALTGALILAFSPHALKWSWLIGSAIWPMFWIEWTRVSIRRKLNVTDWPRQLYL